MITPIRWNYYISKCDQLVLKNESKKPFEISKGDKVQLYILDDNYIDDSIMYTEYDVSYIKTPKSKYVMIKIDEREGRAFHLPLDQFINCFDDDNDN